MKRITLKDIGEKLNLTPGTVSRALRNSHDISKETKRKVLDYTKQINYVPNFSATGLKTGRSNTLAIIVPFISSSFFFDFYEEVSLNLRESKFKLILLQTFNNEKKEKEALEFCIQYNIEGIIISPIKNDSNLSLLNFIFEQISPIIIFDRINHQLNTFKIGIQNEKEVFNATEVLIKNARKDIILLLCKGIGENHARIKGYKNALLRHSIPFKQENILEITYSSPKEEIADDLEEKFKSLLNGNSKPNAVLSTTDTLSLKIPHILDMLGFNVPIDMHVIGFSNTPYANSLNPPLTTIAQPTSLMAKKSVELLLQMIEKKNRKNLFEFKTYFLDCHLRHRMSTS